MESKEYKKQVYIRIQKRIIDLRSQGRKTSKGDDMSFAAIARTLDPPVTRPMVSMVASGRRDTPRIREAIQRELGEAYWVTKRAA